MRTGILFVCTNNVCRSPMAEAVLRAKAQRKGIADRIDVASAGTSGGHAGQRADSRAVTVAARRGYVIAPRKARRVSARDFERFATMLAMDGHNVRALEALRPEGYEGRIALALPSGDIPDPYYGSLATFEHVLDLIEVACDALMRDIARSR
jgi:protein-tyrosine phosphatase